MLAPAGWRIEGIHHASSISSKALPARRPAVFIPSYNGARKLANLVPLLGLLLAREGISVVVHGTAQEPTRVAADEEDEQPGDAQESGHQQARPTHPHGHRPPGHVRGP